MKSRFLLIPPKATLDTTSGMRIFPNNVPSDAKTWTPSPALVQRFPFSSNRKPSAPPGRTSAKISPTAQILLVDQVEDTNAIRLPGVGDKNAALVGRKGQAVWPVGIMKNSQLTSGNMPAISGTGHQARVRRISDAIRNERATTQTNPFQANPEGRWRFCRFSALLAPHVRI